MDRYGIYNVEYRFSNRFVNPCKTFEMTRQDLKFAEDALLNEHNEAKKELYRKYALGNNPYKIGDIIKDHAYTGKINGIKCYYSEISGPMCVYICDRVKSDGSPVKKPQTVHIYQINITQ